MTTVRRLTDSAVLVTTDLDATLFDPGFHTFGYDEFDLSSIGDVTRVFITHEHADHAHPGFVRWLVDRRSDLVVYSNASVRGLLESHDLEVSTEVPSDTSVEDVPHEPLPTGAAPPNRAFTIEGVFTHPGDSRQTKRSAPLMALPLMAPWGSVTGAVEFARRIQPRQVIPIHDFYLDASGRAWVASLAGKVLSGHGIDLIDLGWGDSITL